MLIFSFPSFTTHNNTTLAEVLKYEYSANWNSDFHPVGISMHQAFTIEVFFLMAVVYTRTHKHGIELPWKRAFHHEY